MSINLSKTLLASVVILLTPTISFAQDNPLDHCPSVAAISAVGVDLAEEDKPFWIVGKLNNNYGTDYAWGFTMLVVANTEDEAITKANALLGTLTFKGTEMDIYCSYEGTFNGEPLIAAALPMTSQMRYSFQSMKSLIHQSSHNQ